MGTCCASYRALGVLRKPSVGPQLVYKFAPELLAAATQETVDFFIAAGSTLDPRQLLPALVRFGEPGTAAAKREQVLRYVSFALDHLRCNDRYGAISSRDITTPVLRLSASVIPWYELLSSSWQVGVEICNASQLDS
jgi:hypothetical protein